MAVRRKRKAQVETQAKRRSIQSLRCSRSMGGTTRLEANDPQAERTTLGAVGAPVLDNPPDLVGEEKVCADTAGPNQSQHTARLRR